MNFKTGLRYRLRFFGWPDKLAMTYLENLALAQKIKDFVTPTDKSILISFIFSSESEFTLRYDKNPDTHTRALLQWESIQKNLPLACVGWSDKYGKYMLGYVNDQLRLKIDPQSGRYIFLSCDDEYPKELEDDYEDCQKALEQSLEQQILKLLLGSK